MDQQNPLWVCIVKEIVSDKEDILIGNTIANTQIYIVSGEGQLQLQV